jgi:hypothetical protein
VAGKEFRYVLLCRHAPHDQGQLIPVKGDDGLWRFPSESVASVLAQELVIGLDDLRLAKVVYAPTPEASRTVNLMLRGIQGYTRLAEDKAPAQPDSPVQPDSTARQISLHRATVTVAAPPWLPGPDQDERTKLVVPYEPWDELLPSRLEQTPSGALSRIDELIKQLGTAQEDNVVEQVGKGNAVLVVGHQPQMGWLSDYLSGRSRSVPIAASEVLCLRLQETRKGWRGPLYWQLVPDDSENLDALADKVKGKMDSAKLLSAVITLALTALLGVLLDTNRWTGLAAPMAALAGLSYNGQAAIKVAFALLLAALALYLLTMYYYDRLLMPTRFWAERPDRSGDGVWNRLGKSRGRRARVPQRPPSSSAWVVFRNMQRTWFWLFTPANILVGLALVVLAAALLRLDGWVWAVLAAFALFIGLWAWWFRPILGSED